MLGLLAGLRGTEATLPIIEMRRRDARDVYSRARDVRAERLSGLFQAASLAEQQKRVRFSQNIATKRLGLAERTTLVREDLARQKKAGALGGRGLPAGVVAKDIGAALGIIKLAQDTRRNFLAAGQPGGMIPTLGGLLPPIGRAQQAFAAELQFATNEIKRISLGAARTITELKDISAFAPSFGDRDSTVDIGLKKIADGTLLAVRTKIAALGAAGFDVRGLNQLLIDGGYSGAEVVPSLIPALPAHLSLDSREVLIDELLEEGNP